MILLSGALVLQRISLQYAFLQFSCSKWQKVTPANIRNIVLIAIILTRKKRGCRIKTFLNYRESKCFFLLVKMQVSAYYCFDKFLQD
ncbi:MAG: hypothetical protein JWN76_3625 [Chitinophagaceae bacterium]|nr:hypothetical protein [Chitinophagaceae bacterium]